MKDKCTYKLINPYRLHIYINGVHFSSRYKQYDSFELAEVDEEMGRAFKVWKAQNYPPLRPWLMGLFRRMGIKPKIY